MRCRPTERKGDARQIQSASIASGTDVSREIVYRGAQEWNGGTALPV